MSTDEPPVTQETADSRAQDRLSDLFKAVYHAVRRAQSWVQRESERRLLDYLYEERTEGERTVRVLRTVEVPWPRDDGSFELDRDGAPRTRAIPLFTLVPHHDMALEQVTVRMRVDLQSLQTEQDDGKSYDLRAAMSRPGGDPELLAEIEIKLKGAEPPEGVARLNDRLIKTI